MVRASLQVLPGSNDDIEVVAMLADGGETTDTALADVDVVLMDTSSPTSTA
jgi:DNA-binding NarL/FixJ family response regulator